MYLHVELDREITQPIVPTLCELPKGVLLLENKALVSNVSVMPRYHGGKTANIPVIYRQREGSAQQMEKVFFLKMKPQASFLPLMVQPSSPDNLLLCSDRKTLKEDVSSRGQCFVLLYLLFCAPK